MKTTSSILILLAAYTIVLLMIMISNRMKPGIIKYDTLPQDNFGLFNCLHIAGIIMLMLPAFFIKPLPVFLLSFPDKVTIGQTIIFLAAFGVIGFFPWNKFRKEKNDISSPAVSIILYAFFRIVFLAVCEWFFRGLLLIVSSAWAGIYWAVGINILLYVLLHSHKRTNEMIGCIPFGLLVCVFTIWWQSIWPAIIFHLEVAIINEWPPLQQIISPQKRITYEDLYDRDHRVYR